MKLYYAPGACSLASHLVLRELGIPFDLEKVDTSTKKTEGGRDFLAINPDGYVPAIELQNGKILTEGAAILQYLADQYPDAKLAPAPGTWERTQLHRHLNFIAAELHKSFSPLFQGAEGDAQAAAIEKIGTKFTHFETQFADGRTYLLGDTFSVADAYLFTIANWANFKGIDLGTWPHLKAFVERVAGRQTTRDALTAEGLIEAA